MAYVRKFKTGSGATGVQVCYKERGKVVKTIHIGSAKTEEGIKKLEREARAKINEGKTPLFDLDKLDG